VDALPQPSPDARPPRLKLADVTHAVLRFEDGRRTQAQLEVISITGGLLSMSKPVRPESRAKLMFLTPKGSVFGTAEMLKPLSWSQQPFRFVELEQDDQRRIRESIQSSFTQDSDEQEWIEKYRATLSRSDDPPQRRLFRPLLAGLTLAMVCLGGAFYIFSMHLK